MSYLVRLAKVDCDEHGSVKGTYGVQGFPTLIFFVKGEQLKYNGQRTKDTMVNWLLKKTRPAVTEVEASALSEIASNGKVSIVIHGETTPGFEQLAVLDDYNSTFYMIQHITWSREASYPVKLSRFIDPLQRRSQLLQEMILSNGLTSTKDQLSTHSMIEPSVIFSLKDS